MSPQKKVLIVHNYYQISGGEDSAVINEKQLLEKHGHEVTFYSRDNSELKSMSILKKLLLPFTTIFNIRTYRDIKRIIKKNDIEIVHVHNTLNLISPAVYYAAKACKIPVIQTIHNFRLLCPGATFYRDGHICEDCLKYSLVCAVKHNCYRGNKIQTLACVISTKFHRILGIYGKINYICLTEFNKEKLLRLKQIKSDTVFVKPNYVENTRGFIPEERREDYFVFAGRLDKLKGIDILLKAWKEMGAKAPKLLICGTGPLEGWCKKYIEKNDINVTLKGFVPNLKVREIVARCKALILPTQWYEGFPISIMEAFSVGTPVICSDLGNVGSVVDNGITGIKFKPDSTEELICAVRKCKGMHKSAFEEYQKKYVEEINYKQLITAYMKARK